MFPKAERCISYFRIPITLLELANKQFGVAVAVASAMIEPITDKAAGTFSAIFYTKYRTLQNYMLVNLGVVLECND